MHPKCLKWTRQKNDNTHRHRLLVLRRPKKINNHIGTNVKPHQLRDYRENLGIHRPNQDGCTVMYQLNVKQTWTPVPGLGKHARTDTIYFITKNKNQGIEG